jgi:hypothetical protein
LTRDTVEGKGENPLSFNKYAYGENNPVMNIDPDGYRAVSFYWCGSNIYIDLSWWAATTLLVVGVGVITGIGLWIGNVTFGCDSILFI